MLTIMISKVFIFLSTLPDGNRDYKSIHDLIPTSENREHPGNF